MLLIIGLVVLYWLLGLGTLAALVTVAEDPPPLLLSMVCVAAWPIVLAGAAVLFAVGTVIGMLERRKSRRTTAARAEVTRS